MSKSNVQAMMESNRTENKRELTDTLEKEIGAFLNYPEGGGSMGGSIELTDRQTEILLMIKKNNTISYRAIAEAIGINDSAVKKHLNALKEKGALKRVGGTRGHWEVLD